MRILNSSPAMPATRRGFRVKPCKCWEWESNPRFRIFTSAQLPRVVSQQANPLPYWNGINRPIHISIGIITAPNIFTNPTSLHRFRLVGVIGFATEWLERPVFRMCSPIKDSNLDLCYVSNLIRVNGYQAIGLINFLEKFLRLVSWAIELT